MSGPFAGGRPPAASRPAQGGGPFSGGRPPARRGGFGGGMMFGGGMPTEKSKDFGKSFRRLLGRLAPERNRVLLVIGLAVTSVVFAVLGPRILGNATNLIFEGVISQNLPAGVTQAQVEAGLRAERPGPAGGHARGA